MLLSLAIGLILLVLIVISAAVLFINPNNFKPEIATAVKDKIGRDLVIEGDVKLAFFPTLGITTGKMILHNIPDFHDSQPFASLESSQIYVELLPLLSRKIEVSGVVLNGMRLNLTTNQQGVQNWQDLLSGQKTSHTPPAVVTTPPELNALTTLAIGNVTLINGQINHQNLQTGRNKLIKNINLTADKILFNQPVAIELAFVAVDIQHKTSQTVKLNTLMTVNEKLDAFTLNNSQLQATIVGEHIPNQSLIGELNVANIRASEQNFKATGVQLKVGEALLTADLLIDHVKDNPVLQGTFNIAPLNLANLLKSMGVSMPTGMRDTTALNKFALSTQINASAQSVALQNLVLTLDESTMTGSISSAPIFTANLAIDKLDVDRYLPPVEKGKKVITSPTIALLAVASRLPVESLKNLNTDSHLAIATLKMNDLNLQGMQLHLNAKEGVLKTNQIIKSFYQGEYAGNLVMDTRPAKPLLSIEEKLSHVQIEPLLQDFKGKAILRGTLDTAAQLRGQGLTEAELRASLQGYVKVDCKDGAVLGFSVQSLIDKGKAMLKGSNIATDMSSQQTAFSAISATAAIASGLMSNQDLLAKTDKVQLSGQGTANLVTESLDYRLTANLLKEAATSTEPEQLRQTPIVIVVAGTFSQPHFSLDLSAMLTEKTKEKIEKVIETIKTEENKAKVEQVIDNKAKVEQVLDKLKPEEKEKIKQLTPKLGKLFKKLF